MTTLYWRLHYGLRAYVCMIAWIFDGCKTAPALATLGNVLGGMWRHKMAQADVAAGLQPHIVAAVAERLHRTEWCYRRRRRITQTWWKGFVDQVQQVQKEHAP